MKNDTEQQTAMHKIFLNIPMSSASNARPGHSNPGLPCEARPSWSTKVHLLHSEYDNVFATTGFGRSSLPWGPKIPSMSSASTTHSPIIEERPSWSTVEEHEKYPSTLTSLITPLHSLNSLHTDESNACPVQPLYFRSFRPPWCTKSESYHTKDNSWDNRKSIGFDRFAREGAENRKETKPIDVVSESKGTERKISTHIPLQKERSGNLPTDIGVLRNMQGRSEAGGYGAKDPSSYSEADRRNMEDIPHHYKSEGRTRNKYYDVCNNCGKQGHTFKQCKNPITSFGVIIFRIHQNQRQYLMIRRKDTLGYIDFMRGKYSVSNQNYILNMLKQMTVQEKHKLMTYTFDELWKDLWDGDDLQIDATSNVASISSNGCGIHAYSEGLTTFHRGSRSPEENDTSVSDKIDKTVSEPSSSLNYRQEESNSREKFNYLSSKIMGGNAPNPHHMYILPSGQTILQYLLMVSNIPDIWKCEADPIPHQGGGWSEPEWGFPKGRRNFQEKDYECALREMTEETGYPAHLVQNIKNILPFDEIFMGSNYKSYKHRYYLMYMNYEDSLMMDNFEKSEVSRMEWKSYEECMEIIRPYNLEKKRLITQIEHTLLRYRLFL